MSGEGDGVGSARESLDAFFREQDLIIGWKAAEILHILDQRIEHAVHRAQSLELHPLRRAVRNIVRKLGGAGPVAVDDGAQRAQHPAHGVDLDLEKIQAILKHRGPVAHFKPPVVDVADSLTAGDAPHPISGTPV